MLTVLDSNAGSLIVLLSLILDKSVLIKESILMKNHWIKCLDRSVLVNIKVYEVYIQTAALTS